MGRGYGKDKGDEISKKKRPANKKPKKGDDEGNLEQTKRGKFA